MKIRLEIGRNRAIAITISIIMQCLLGLFLGHHYDMGIFFTVGHEVSHGVSPYGIFPSREMFKNPAFLEQLPGIGYPPPWALYLGLVYLVLYDSTKNIFIYNLGIKLPSILSNVALAFLVERIAVQEGAARKSSRKIFYFFLFNPFMIYVSAIWGQFDSFNTLITVFALNELHDRRIKKSSVLLALSASLKILPLILMPLFILFIKRNCGLRSSLEFIVTCAVSFVAFSYVPFVVFGWNPGVIFDNLGYHFNRAGGFTPLNIVELLCDQSVLPPSLEFLGLVWIPALALGYYQLLRTSLNNRMDLVRWASSLSFILLLTRSWVSEQNVIMLIPFVMLVTVVKSEGWHTTNLMWVTAFVFSFLNTSPFQMFFLVSPEPLNFMMKLDRSFRAPRLFLRFVSVLPWQALGWSYVSRTFRH